MEPAVRLCVPVNVISNWVESLISCKVAILIDAFVTRRTSQSLLLLLAFIRDLCFIMGSRGLPPLYPEDMVVSLSSRWPTELSYGFESPLAFS